MDYTILPEEKYSVYSLSFFNELGKNFLARYKCVGKNKQNMGH
jgi:hypothetical protein